MKGRELRDHGPAPSAAESHDGSQDEAHTPTGSSLRDRWPLDRVVLVLGVTVATAMALWMTSGAWGSRAPAGDDVMGHLAKTEFAIRHLIGEGRLTGWNPRFILGYEEFLFLGPGFTWAVALIHALSLGVVSIPGAFKVVTIASFVAVPLTVAFLARSFGLGRRAAAAAAILSLAVNSNFGGMGVLGLFGIGLVPHQFAAPFFFLALGGALRVLRAPGFRWVVFTALMLVVLLISHGRSAVVLAVVLVIVLAAMSVARELQRPQVLTRQNLSRLAAAGVIACGLAAFVLVPLAAHRDLQGLVTAWAHVPFTERLGQIWRGETLFGPRVATLLFAGFAYGLHQWTADRRSPSGPHAFALAVTPLAYLAFAHAAVDIWPDNVVAAQLPDRGLGFVGVLAVLPLSALVERISLPLGRAGGAVAVAIAAAIVVVPLDQTLDVVEQMPDPVPQMHEAADELARVVPDGARFATERDFPGEIERTGVSHPDFWLAWASGRNTLNSFGIESTTSAVPAYEAEHIVDRPPEAVADALSRLGVTHLVTVSEAGAQHVSATPRFEEVWHSPPLAMFAVTGPPGQPEPASLVTASSPLEATLLRAEPEHLLIEVDASTRAQATVAVGWSPKWHASLDGRDVALHRTDDGLLSLTLPPGEHRMTLRFRADLWDWLGRGMTLLTIAALLVWRSSLHFGPSKVRKRARGPG